MVVEDQGQVMLISVHDETDSFFLSFFLLTIPILTSQSTRQAGKRYDEAC